jgi:hypothetical protein
VRVRALLMLVALLIAASTAGAAAPVARNLVATPAVKSALRTTLLARLPAAERAKVRGPLPDRTYYGSYGATRYALAVFSFPHTGTTDQPEVFVKRPGKRWVDRGDTGGCLAKIPAPLLRVWRLGPATC